MCINIIISFHFEFSSILPGLQFYNLIERGTFNERPPHPPTTIPKHRPASRTPPFRPSFFSLSLSLSLFLPLFVSLFFSCASLANRRKGVASRRNLGDAGRAKYLSWANETGPWGRPCRVGTRKIPSRVLYTHRGAAGHEGANKLDGRPRAINARGTRPRPHARDTRDAPRPPPLPVPPPPGYRAVGTGEARNYAATRRR